MQVAGFKVSTPTAIMILTGVISLYPVMAVFMVDYAIPSYGTISYGPSLILPLHTDGRYVKDANNNTIILHGAWKCESLGEGCISSFSFEGENYLTWESATTWRPDAVREVMQQMRAWGFNSYAETMWANWWIEDARTTLGEPVDSVITEISYRQCVKNILAIAQEEGLYVQLRIFSPEAGIWGLGGEGRVECPFPAGAYTHAGHIFPDAEAFADFWYDMAYELAGFPNAIFCIYDEPAVSTSIWFPAAELCIQKIRQAEFDAAGYSHIILNQYSYCGDCLWMEQWIQQGYTTEPNIVFSNHLYRHDDSFGSGTNSSLDFVRHYICDYGIWEPDGSGSLAYKYIIDTYNVPIMVTATGAVDPDETNDLEYETFKNSLMVLNELEVGYWGFLWYSTDVDWKMMTDPKSRAPSTANRVGQALIDAIASAPY